MLPPVIFHFYRERPRFASPRDLFFNRERGTDFLALVGENFEKNRFLSWISATTTSIFIALVIMMFMVESLGDAGHGVGAEA